MCFWFKKKPVPPDPVSPYPTETLEIPSPRDIVPLSDITINIRGAQTTLAVIADSNSMDPLFDIGHNAILTPFTDTIPFRKEDLVVGDIVVYQAGTRFIVHRIIEITGEGEGRVYKIQGDNTANPDPYMITNPYIKYLVIGVVY